AQAARVAIGVGVVLRVAVQLADVDLANQRRDVLVVFVARLGLGDAYLPQYRRIQAHHAKLRYIAFEFLQAFHGPRRHDAAELPIWNAVFFFERIAEPVGMEQPQRRFIYRRAFERIDGVGFHQRLQPLGNRRLAAAYRPQQIQDLLALFQALRSMLEESHDLVDDFFQAEEFFERGVATHDPVGEQPGQPWIVAGVDQFGFAYRRQHAFCRAGIGHGVFSGQSQVFLEGKFGFLVFRVQRLEAFDDVLHG